MSDSIEGLLHEAYSTTHNMLKDTDLGSVVKHGLLISYGPPIPNPDLLLLSFQGEAKILRYRIHGRRSFSMLTARTNSVQPSGGCVENRAILLAPILRHGISHCVSSSADQRRHQMGERSWVLLGLA